MSMDQKPQWELGDWLPRRLPGLFRNPFTDEQRQWLALASEVLGGNKRRWRTTSRGMGATTFLLGLAAYALCTDQSRLCVVITGSRASATDWYRAFKGVMTTPGLYIHNKIHRHQLVVRGSGDAFRGIIHWNGEDMYRPDLLLLDDPQHHDTRNEAVQRHVLGVSNDLFDRSQPYRVFGLGTNKFPRDLAQTLGNPESFPEWHPEV